MSTKTAKAKRKNDRKPADPEAALPETTSPAPGFANVPGSTSVVGWGWNTGLYQRPGEDNLATFWRPNLSTDISALLNRERHRLLLSDARYLVETFDILAETIQQKSEYVSQAGFAPNFTGKDHAWGKLAREALIEANDAVNIRGPLYPWDRTWQITSTSPDTDGGCFVVFGETETGFPQLQFLEAHRIGSRCADGRVETGAFAGSRLLNGIFYDEQSRELGYRVLGPTQDQDRDISAADMMHIAVPRWHSDGRPFPNVAYGLLSLYDAKQARGFQLAKQKANSAITMVEETPDGAPPKAVTVAAALHHQQVAAAAITAGRPVPPAPGTPANPLVNHLDGGLIRYVKAGQGKLTSHMDTTPGEGWLAFDQRMIESAINGIGWSHYMLDLSKFGGAATRGFQDQINTKIYARWLSLVPFILRAQLFVLSKLIARGDVPPHPEWAKWAYSPPAEFTVDGGRAVKADLDNCRAGVESRPALIARYGKTPEEVLRAEARFLELQRDIEAEFKLEPGSLATLAPVTGQVGAAPAGQVLDPNADDEEDDAPAKKKKPAPTDEET